MSVSDPRLNKPWTWKTTTNLAGSAIGIVVGLYAGANLLVPGVAGCIAFWILRKTGWIKSKSLTVAASVQAGQAIWMLVGLVAVLLVPSRSPIWSSTAIWVEIIAYAGAVVVLVWRQEKWIVIVLLAYHVLCTILNVMNLAGLVPAVIGPHTIVAHLLLRGAAVVFLIQFLREKPKENFVEVF